VTPIKPVTQEERAESYQSNTESKLTVINWHGASENIDDEIMRKMSIPQTQSALMHNDNIQVDLSY